MDSILDLNTRLNQIFSFAKALSHRFDFAQLQHVLQQVYTMLASLATRKKLFIFQVNLQLLKLQFPLQQSYLHLNLYFRSSHHLQLSYHCSSPNFFEEFVRKPFLRRLKLCQIDLAPARKPCRRRFLSAQENGDFGAMYVTDGAKLRSTDLDSGSSIPDSLCYSWTLLSQCKQVFIL